MPRRRIDRKDKQRHREFVWLAPSEYAHLRQLLGERETERWIDELNLYLGSKGDKYESHYYTIQVWARRAGKTTVTKIAEDQTAAKRAADTVLDALKHPAHKSMPEFTPVAHQAAYTALARMGLSWPELRRRIAEDPADLAEFREKFLGAYENGK